LQSDGRTFVDVSALAQALNGSVAFEPDRVILTVPGAAGGAPSAGLASAPSGALSGDEAAAEPEPETISKEFANAGLNAVGLMRDWKIAVETMIAYQLPAGGSYYQDLQYRAEEGLRRASLVASTTPDQQALTVLQRGYAKLSNWAGSAVATRMALNATRTSNPDYLKNDQELQRITECGRGLSSMLVSLQYADVPSCY
jgi:hypothetical protein